MSHPKIGTLDIETAPLDSHTWGLFDQTVGLNQIAREWSILSFCYKPMDGGRKDIIYRDTRNEADPRADGELLKELWDILHDTDIVVAQNGVRFDMKKINARMILEGYAPYRPVKVQDTMLMARQVAAFTSNKLEWLSQYLSPRPKLKHKDFPGFELWAECLNGNVKAWRSMEKYNIQDVLATEDVYKRLRPWVKGHINVAVYNDEEHMQCSVCGHDSLRRDERNAFTQVGEYHQYQCNGCGAWMRDRYTINSTAKRKALLSN